MYRYLKYLYARKFQLKTHLVQFGMAGDSCRFVPKSARKGGACRS